MRPLRRAITTLIAAMFALASFAPLADAKDRHKRKHRVKAYAVHLHDVRVVESRRGDGRVKVYWLGPYGVMAARSGGRIIGSAFALDPADALTPDEGRQALARGAPETIARLCEQEAAGSPDDTTARLSSTVDATADQRNALDELRATMGDAARFLRETCPTDVPLDPVTRFSVLQKQIHSMRRAIEMLKPPLARFEQSLSDEQRGRLSSKTQPVTQAEGQRSGGEICEATGAITRLPVDRIARTVRPRREQREALMDAYDASVRAAETLAKNCRQPTPMTPLARLEGMERQLKAAADAVEIVNAANRDFYDTLMPHQKARFDRMNSTHAMRRDRTLD